MLDLIEEPCSIITALEAARIEFAVCGARRHTGHGVVPVVSRRGLVEMKRLRGSGQDLDDIRALEEEDGAA